MVKVIKEVIYSQLFYCIWNVNFQVCRFQALFDDKNSSLYELRLKFLVSVWSIILFKFGFQIQSIELFSGLTSVVA